MSETTMVEFLLTLLAEDRPSVEVARDIDEVLAIAWDQGYLARCDATYERPIPNPYRRGVTA